MPDAVKRVSAETSESETSRSRDFQTDSASASGRASGAGPAPLHAERSASERLAPAVARRARGDEQGATDFDRKTSREMNAGRPTGLWRRVRVPAPDAKQGVRADHHDAVRADDVAEPAGGETEGRRRVGRRALRSCYRGHRPARPRGGCLCPAAAARRSQFVLDLVDCSRSPGVGSAMRGSPRLLARAARAGASNVAASAYANANLPHGGHQRRRCSVAAAGGLRCDAPAPRSWQ